MKKLLLVAAALSLGGAPIAASAQVERASAPVEDASSFGGDGPTITAIVALVAIVAGVVLATGGDDEPVSP